MEGAGKGILVRARIVGYGPGGARAGQEQIVIFNEGEVLDLQ